MSGTFITHYTAMHELVDYGLCSNGIHNVLLKIGNMDDARHKDVTMSLTELKDLYQLIGDFLKGVEE